MTNETLTWAWRGALLLALVFVGYELHAVRTTMPADESRAIVRMADDLRAVREKLSPSPEKPPLCGIWDLPPC